MNNLRKEISELKEEISDISRDMFYCKWHHRDIRQELETMRSEFANKEEHNISTHNDKISQKHINHFFGIKRSTLLEIGVYQQRIEMYKNKNSDLENEVQQIQMKNTEQIKENETQIKKMEQLLNLIDEINV